MLTKDQREQLSREVRTVISNTDKNHESMPELRKMLHSLSDDGVEEQRQKDINKKVYIIGAVALGAFAAYIIYHIGRSVGTRDPQGLLDAKVELYTLREAARLTREFENNMVEVYKENLVGSAALVLSMGRESLKILDKNTTGDPLAGMYFNVITDLIEVIEGEVY